MPLKPLCFMIMPYGRKPTQALAGKGPPEINFNALWDHAFVPAIQALGYEPVRADQDVGALIINQMLERLYFADLVLADMTIPNGNVYYEVGIRHAARKNGCVLLAADWSLPLFDVAQMRTVRYPLADGEVGEPAVAGIIDALSKAIPALANGASPMHQSLPGYPDAVDPSKATSMKAYWDAIAAFQAQGRAIRASPKNERMANALVLARSDMSGPMIPSIVLSGLALLRDAVDSNEDWRALLEVIDTRLTALAQDPTVREYKALALSNLGQHSEAIALLEALVATDSATPERLGLLGGRYKRLWQLATTDVDQRSSLAKAIESYERGMELDLNSYYCSSNLPRLYRARNRKGDAERAQLTLHVVIAACERAKKRGAADEWLRPTLLGAAFDAGDIDKAEELSDEVRDEGAAKWKVASLLQDLARSANQVTEADNRDRFLTVLATLKALA